MNNTTIFNFDDSKPCIVCKVKKEEVEELIKKIIDYDESVRRRTYKNHELLKKINTEVRAFSDKEIEQITKSQVVDFNKTTYFTVILFKKYKLFSLYYHDNNAILVFILNNFTRQDLYDEVNKFVMTKEYIYEDIKLSNYDKKWLEKPWWYKKDI